MMTMMTTAMMNAGRPRASQIRRAVSNSGGRGVPLATASSARRRIFIWRYTAGSQRRPDTVYPMMPHITQGVVQAPAVPDGNYYLGVSVDDPSVNAEFNEANNTSSRAIGVFKPIWQDVTEKRPKNARAFEYLGDRLTDEQRLDEAVAAYLRAVELFPQNGKVHFSLSNLYDHLGQRDASEEHLILALEHDPALVGKLFAFGLELLRLGRPEEGLRRLRRAVELRPKAMRRVTHLAWILATAPDAALRDGPEAVRLAERACTPARKPGPHALDVLAAAYAETGRFDEAETTASYAVNQARSAGDEAMVRAIEERIAGYRAGRPARAPLR